MFGLDHLGGAKYGDLLVREHPEGWAAGFFANTFGNAWPVIEKLLSTGRCPRVRIHAVWADDHTYRPNEHAPIIRREAKRAESLKHKFPNVEVQFSPFCEHTTKGDLLTMVISDALRAAPSCTIVNSVWTGDVVDCQRVLNEVHGSHRKPAGIYNYSFDGLSSVDSDVQNVKGVYQDADTFYFWHPAFNGKLKSDDKTPRDKRKSWPTSELIDSIIYLHRDPGSVKLPKGYIWKSHADRHNTPPEARAYKPVLIAPVKAPRAELVTENGQVVAVSSQAQTFNGGGWRYYFSQYGYQLAEKARRIHGKGTVSLRLNGKVVGTLNPAFRAGSFR